MGSSDILGEAPQPALCVVRGFSLEGSEGSLRCTRRYVPRMKIACLSARARARAGNGRRIWPVVASSFLRARNMHRGDISRVACRGVGRSRACGSWR